VSYQAIPEFAQMQVLDGLVHMVLHAALLALTLTVGLIAGLCLLDGCLTGRR
jgi:hypothetical protein